MNVKHTRLSRRHSVAGFSLLEVLVAVVVLSVGLLGLAALQLKGLQAAHSGFQRTLASVIANDAAERLWLAWPSPAPVDEAAYAANVQEAWRTAWQAGDAQMTLPGLEGTSLIVSNGAQTFTITVNWNEGRFANDDVNAASFSYRITLPSL